MSRTEGCAFLEEWWGQIEYPTSRASQREREGERLIHIEDQLSDGLYTAQEQH